MAPTKCYCSLRRAAGFVSLEKDFAGSLGAIQREIERGREQRQRKLVVGYHPPPSPLLPPSLFSAARRIPTGSNSTNSLDLERCLPVFHFASPHRTQLTSNVSCVRYRCVILIKQLNPNPGPLHTYAVILIQTKLISINSGRGNRKDHAFH